MPVTHDTISDDLAKLDLGAERWHRREAFRCCAKTLTSPLVLTGVILGPPTLAVGGAIIAYGLTNVDKWETIPALEIATFGALVSTFGAVLVAGAVVDGTTAYEHMRGPAVDRYSRPSFWRRFMPIAIPALFFTALAATA